MTAKLSGFKNVNILLAAKLEYLSMMAKDI